MPNHMFDVFLKPQESTATSKDLFGDSEEESDEELLPDKKREAESPGEGDQPTKKRRVLEDDDEGE